MSTSMVVLARAATVAGSIALAPIAASAQTASPPVPMTPPGPVGSTYQCPNATTAPQDHYGCIPKHRQAVESVVDPRRARTTTK